MFEYAALVDAPVQRFTGIVTGPDPDDAVAFTADLPTATPERIAPVMPSTPLIAATPVAPMDPSVHPRIDSPNAAPARTTVAPPPPTPAPQFVPALVAIAAAGLTAMWWLRREGHDRRR